MFFSHNKLAGTVFRLVFLAKRTGPFCTKAPSLLISSNPAGGAHHRWTILLLEFDALVSLPFESETKFQTSPVTSLLVSPRSPLFTLLRTLHHFHRKITVFSRSSSFNCSTPWTTSHVEFLDSRPCRTCSSSRSAQSHEFTFEEAMAGILIQSTASWA